MIDNWYLGFILLALWICVGYVFYMFQRDKKKKSGIDFTTYKNKIESDKKQAEDKKEEK